MRIPNSNGAYTSEGSQSLMVPANDVTPADNSPVTMIHARAEFFTFSYAFIPSSSRNLLVCHGKRCQLHLSGNNPERRGLREAPASRLVSERGRILKHNAMLRSRSYHRPPTNM